MYIVQFVGKNVNCILRRWSACYSTEPFTRHDVVMQENSSIAFIYLFSWICSSIPVFTGCLDKHNVNFKVSSTCLNVDKIPGGRRGLFSDEIRETHKTMQVF